MRLTYVIPYFAPAWAYGGPPRLAYDLARATGARGHAVRVLTTDALDARRRARPRCEQVAPNIHIQRFPNVSNRLAWHYKLFFPRGFAPAFAATLEMTDVVHLFDFRDYQNAVALPYLARSEVPFVLSALGELPRAAGLKRPVKVVFDELVGCRLLRRAAALIAQTPQEATAYLRLGAPPARVKLVPLAIDLHAIPPEQVRGGFRSRLGIGLHERVILFVGRIHAYKGLDLLIRAVAQLRTRHSDVRLVVAGRDDGYLLTAQRLASEVAPAGGVIFSGPVYNDDRFQAYRDADIFAITPSHAEQTSLAALEAAACGTPVLVSEQAPIPGLDRAQAGLTVRQEVDAVVHGLETLLNADRSVLAANARQLVRDQFSLPMVARTLEDVYAEALLNAHP